MLTYVIRLKKGQDLKQEIIKLVQEKNIKAGCILTCVGHLTQATLRMADASIIKTWEEEFEILSLNGTLSQDDIHLHIAISNKEGDTFGGHLKEGCLIGVTAEIIIADLSNEHIFSREYDPNTGYNELKINK